MLTDTSTYLYLRAHNWWEDQKGQGMAEYALILALIAIVVIATLFLLGEEIDAVFNYIKTELGDQVPEG